jgi:hypothetical protein
MFVEFYRPLPPRGAHERVRQSGKCGDWRALRVCVCVFGCVCQCECGSVCVRVCPPICFSVRRMIQCFCAFARFEQASAANAVL